MNEKNTVNFIIYFLGLIAYTVFIFDLHAQSPSSSVLQTQSKLRELNAQIHSLEKKLSSAHDKRDILNQELSATEKQISTSLRKLRAIQNNMNNKQRHMVTLHQQVKHVNQELSRQQQLLAKHVQAHYQMGNYQPLKWLINQEDPQKIGRMLTYYQYIINSRQRIIEQIEKTRSSLSANKKLLHHELSVNKQLQATLRKHQQQLQENQQYHKALIHSLNNEIQDKQNFLHEAQKNKDSLESLLKSLSRHSSTQSNSPFLRMRKKLPFPVHTSKHSLKKMHQGITFFAKEGAVVTAVYPGKVVFSDWLKGYGLLLIIDHGQGFMTLYAHNQSLFKSKGQNVQQNEQIASVGHSGGIKQDGLYFEIRLRGKTVPPLNWLSPI